MDVKAAFAPTTHSHDSSDLAVIFLLLKSGQEKVQRPQKDSQQTTAKFMNISILHVIMGI